jgi:four helix bundle protein
MPSQPEELRERTKQFAIRIVKLFRALPKTEEARVLRKQVLRSGTSVAANYRAVCRSRSRADFISTLAVVTEEADETAFWLELLIETDVVRKTQLEPLLT